MAVPYAFANLSGNIALAKLDSNFNTPITIGNTSVLLGNTVTTLNNLTLANVTITSGTSNVTNVNVTSINVTNVTATLANITTLNVASSYVTASNVATAVIGNLTLSNALTVANGGTGANTSTGSGSIVLSISPTLVTPLLGTPTSGNLVNCTFPTLNQNTTGTAAGLSSTLAVSSGGTGLTTTPANGALDIGNGTGFTRTTLTQGSGVTITNTSGAITISATGLGGTVTSVTGTSPVSSSGGTTPAISLAASYGDTQNPYASKTANYILAAPNGSAGVPTFRAIVANDIPTLNQNTSGTAAGLSATLAVGSGGTGLSSLTSNSVLLGNASSTIQFVSPGSNGNVLTSNGTTWLSSAPSGGGGAMTLITTLSPTNGSTSVSATSISSYKSILVAIDSIAVSANAGLTFAVSSDNGTNYSTSVTFTNTNGTTPRGYIQTFRTDNSSSNKPYYVVNVNAPSAGEISDVTGTVNAVRIAISNASTFTGTGNIFLYGIN